MVSPARAAVVPVRFPFSDLSQAKLRPAVILADAGRGDWLLCQVTSNPLSDSAAIPITVSDFASGTLRPDSYARPAKLFTANLSVMVGHAGVLKAESFERIVEAVVSLLRAK